MYDAAPTALLLSQNVSVPARRRTWQQAQALVRAGWKVRILCPRAENQSSRELIDGVDVRRFTQLFEGKTKAGILIEYALAFFAVTVHLIAARVRGPITVIQVVNPPDWVVIPALLMRPFGSRIVFDLTDISTSLFVAKFSQVSLLLPVLAYLERIALRFPDLVLTANETYRRFAIRKGGRTKGGTVAVHSYPETLPELGVRSPGPVRIGYFGILGSHDGVGCLIEAVAHLDGAPFELIIVGDGPAMPSLRRLAQQNPNIHFTGFLSGEAREATIASFDIAVIADPANRYTHSISMNKAFVYAAHGLAVISTPLRETKRLLPCALFARDDSPTAVADCLQRALIDTVLRTELGNAARAHAENVFDWCAESTQYVNAMRALVSEVLK